MASFFESQNNAGLALLVLAIVSIVMAIVTVIVEIVDGDDILIGNIVAAIGSLLGGILYLGFAKRVRGGSSNGKLGEKLGLNGGALNGKFVILAEYVHVFAFVEIIAGVFNLIGGIINGNAAIGSGVLSILIGILAFWAYNKLMDGKDTLADQIIWIVLLVIFILEIISGIIVCLAIITIPLGICMIIIGVFMLLALLDKDIKAQFGM